MTHRRVFLLVAGTGGLLYAGFSQDPAVNVPRGVGESDRAPGWQAKDAVEWGTQWREAETEQASVELPEDEIQEQPILGLDNNPLVGLLVPE